MMGELTIKDIAKACGVGVSTVSRAINNHPDINPETRKKIMDIIAEKGRNLRGKYNKYKKEFENISNTFHSFFESQNEKWKIIFVTIYTINY